MSMERPRRYIALDGLRGAAALLVVLFHMRWSTHFMTWEAVRNGYLAVDLFFILSGFVIAANYADRIADGAMLRKFVTLRFFRLYPLHVAILLLLVGKELLKAAFGAGHIPPFAPPNTPAGLAANLFLLQGLGLDDTLGWNTPSWSIGDEFIAYLVFGFLVIYGVARQRAFLAASAVCALAVYAVLGWTHDTLDLTFDYGLLRCLAGFFLGVATRAAIVGGAMNFARRLPDGLFAMLEAAALAACVAIMAFASGAAVTAAIPAFVALLAVLQFDRGPLAHLLATRPARFLGDMSYSIYMVHMPLFLTLYGALGRLPGVTTAPGGHDGAVTYLIDPWLGDLLAAAALLAILAIARLTYRFIEEPGRSFGRRLGMSRATAPLPAPTALSPSLTDL